MAPSRGPKPIARTLHATLEGHKGPVNVARYSKKQASYVLTGGQDRSVRLWNAATGAQIKAYTSHGYEVLCLCVGPDNDKFASGGGDRSVFVWDVTSEQTIRRVSGHVGKVNAVEFNHDATVLASGSYDATVRLWDLKSQNRTPIQTLDEHTDAVQSIHIGGYFILTGSVDGYVRTYDLRMGQLRADNLGHPVTAAIPTQDAQTYLATTLDGHVRLMDAATGKMLNDFSGHTNEAYKIRGVFGHAEASVVCGDEKGAVWAWDLLDGTPMAPNPPPKVHDKVITWTEHHPINADEMVTASGDGTVKIWRNPSDT